MQVSPTHSPAEEGRILTAAAAKVADCWRLSDEQMAAILGLEVPVESIRSGSALLQRGSPSFVAAQHLVRLFQILDAFMGGDDEASISWLHMVNLDVGACPIDIIRTPDGLIAIADYVAQYRRVMGLEDFSTNDLAALMGDLGAVTKRRI